MDEQDEGQAGEADEPVTERVRIVGAQPAGDLAGGPAQSDQVEGERAAAGEGDEPDGGETRSEEHYLGFVHRSAASSPPADIAPPPALEPAESIDPGELAVVPPELPHWADPPTGQVPAVLDSRGDETEEEAWATFTDSGPVWREHQHEWADSGGFEPAMLADDETRVGALDEAPLEERRPWEFDDLTPITGVEAVGRLDEAYQDDEAGEDDRGEIPGEDSRAASGVDLPVTEGPGAAFRRSWWDEEEDGPGSVSGADALSEPTSALPTWSQRTSTHPARSSAEAAGPVSVATPAPPSPASEAQAGPSSGGEMRTRPFETPPARRVAAPRRLPGTGAASGRRTGAGAGSGGRTPEVPERRNVPLAVGTGLVAAAIVVVALLAGPLPTLVLATVCVTLAAAEAYASFRRAGMRPATLLGLAATVAVMVSAYDKGIAALPLVTVLLVITAMIWYLVGAERGSAVEGISSTLLGFMWVGVLGSFVALMLAPSVYPHRHGLAFAFGAVVATVAADVGALVFGSWLGRHQLAPHVSPNKTWEGWVGGAVLAVAASVLITGHVHPWTPGKAAILGAMVAFVAPVGDLCESLVKRSLGLKDMGSLLPGHGGVLDRMDALLFVLPATYYLVRVLNLG